MRNSWIDVCRALAVIFVVIHHSAQVLEGYNSSLMSAVLLAGQYGVQLFFIISALTIFSSLERGAGDFKSKIYRFYIRRYFRIAPLYYVGLIFYGAWWFSASLFPGVRGFWGEYTFINVVANLFFLHTFMNSGANNIVVPGGWSIGVEMVFYVFAPFVYFLIGRSVVKYVFLAICTFLLGYEASQLMVGGEADLAPIKNNSYYYFWFPAQAFIFLVGFALYNSISEEVQTGRGTSVKCGLLAAFVLAFAAPGIVYLGMIVKADAVMLLPLVSVACGAIVLMVSSAHDVIPFSNFFVEVGKRSYSIYLTHFAFQNIWLFLSRRYGLLDHVVSVFGLLASNILVFSSIFLLSFVVSGCTKKYIEDRFISIGSRVAAKLS